MLQLSETVVDTCQFSSLQLAFQLQVWLAVVGGLKGAKGLSRWREARRARVLEFVVFGCGSPTVNAQPQLQEWLAVLGGLKGAKGLFRWREARRAAALQLGDIEPGVQQAALRCLKVCNPWFSACSSFAVQVQLSRLP